jgi:ElaB/YqjD/DUF883 family membrane-anchored ribosome-binding protein
MHHGNGGEPLNDPQRRMKQLVDEATEKGRALLNEGLENAKELLDEQTALLKKKAAEYGLDDAANGVRSYVKKNPLKSVGIAVAIGLILGRIVAPSSKE